MFQSTSSRAAYCCLFITRARRSSHLRSIPVDEACQLQEAVGGYRPVAWSWRLIWESVQQFVKSALEGLELVSVLYVGREGIEETGTSAAEEVVPGSL